MSMASTEPGTSREVMDQLHTMLITANKAHTNLTAFRDKIQQRAEAVYNNVKNLDEQLLKDDQDQVDLSVTGVMLWEGCVRRSRDTLQQLATEHREMHSSVSRVGKEVDKTLVADLTGVCRREEHYEQSKAKRELVNSLIVQRLISQGLFDVAECLQREAGAPVNTAQREQFAQVNDIVRAIRAHDLQPAIQWLETHKDALNARHSRLALQVHCQQFIQLALGDRRAHSTAIKYARTHLQPYANREPEVICRLMGLLAFAKGGNVTAVRYLSLINDTRWLDLADRFAQEACQVLGLPVDDPLTTVLQAGTHAVPQLLSLKHVMMSRQVHQTIWSSHSDELPIAITLAPNQPAYHSVFSCPILRQQTTDSNPPVRLTCGHCISQDALHKLQQNNRLKCPYCPLESLTPDTLVLHF